MKYCIFDTESNGLFDYALPADAPTQPRLLHFAAFGVDDDRPGHVDIIDRYIKPDGFTIDESGEAFRVNGLTQAKLEAEGHPIKEVLEEYVQIIDAGYIMYAYNAQHDLKQMRAELRRAGMDDRFTATKNCCLMRSVHRKEVGVKKPDGGRGFPKLVDACAHFGIQMGRQHEGLNDAAAAYKLFMALRERDLLIAPTVHFATDRPPADEQKKMEF